MKTFNAARLLVFALILSLLSGCAQLVYLDQAQQAFNEGASLENAAKLDSGQLLTSGEPAELNRISGQNLATTSPETYYNLAYSRVKKALEKEDKLRQDEVLATALTLKALCEWKLGKYGAATRSSDMALKEMSKSEVQLPRDQAVMTALPGLIAVDRAYHNFDTLEAFALLDDNRLGLYTSADAAQKAFLKAKDHYTRFIIRDNAAQNLPDDQLGDIAFAFKKFDAAARQLEPAHPVRLYLVMSQLAALKTWGDTHARIRNLRCTLFEENEHNRAWLPRIKDWLAAEEKWIAAEFSRYEARRKEVLEELARLSGGKNSAAYKHWDGLLLSTDLRC